MNMIMRWDRIVDVVAYEDISNLRKLEIGNRSRLKRG